MTLRRSSVKAMAAARIATALGAALVLVTGCTSGGPSSAGRVSLGDARSSAAASHAVSASTTVKVSYGSWGFTTRRPDEWRSHPYEFIDTLGGPTH